MPEGFVHNIDPVIVRIAGLSLYWYGAVYTLGFLGIFAWFALRHRRLGWSMAEVFELAILTSIGVLVGGRVFNILVYELNYYQHHPLQALDWWQGGMASHGLMLGGLAGVLLFCRLRRRSFIVTADELAVPAAFLLGIGRIGNFIEGGVIGSATSMPWGVIFPGVEGARHPVALYDGVKNLLLIPILIAIGRRFPAGRGVSTGAFLFLYGALRFAVDLFRDYEGEWIGIGQGQYFNLLMALAGLIVLVLALSSRPAITGGEAQAVPARTPGFLRATLFVLLCVYPLGIPTSWTRAHIESIRVPETVPDASQEQWPPGDRAGIAPPGRDEANPALVKIRSIEPCSIIVASSLAR